MTSTGRTPYYERNMAQPWPSASPADTMAWERRTWVDHVASLINFRDHVQPDIPTPTNRQPAPSTYMTLMYNRHYTLFATNYNATTDNSVVHGTDSLLPAEYTPPPPAQPRPPQVHQGGRA